MKLKLEEFLKCSIYYEDLRKNHRGLITNNHTLKTVQDIIEYFSIEENVIRTNNLVTETNLSKLYSEPLNLNNLFWNSGNNFFYYCILYQFRHDIIQYKGANNYIEHIKTPMLYSSKYYASKMEMTDEEITQFLEKNPIGINNNIIMHGVHRACAMIGRIIINKSYIPFSLGRGY